MFHGIPKNIQDRMRELEAIDARDRIDGTPRLERLRQIPPETGKFIALLAAGTPAGEWIEIGTSAGYSTMWIALACMETGRQLTTFELLAEKAAIAETTLRVTNLTETVKLVRGDAREQLRDADEIAFCFLDAEKEMYGELYDLVIPRLVPGGLLVADNAISHADDLAGVIEKAESDARIDTLVVPIGKGELVCRKR
jgi:predicted O-methyltransferase YrrM